MTDNIPLAQVIESVARKLMSRLSDHDQKLAELQKVDAAKDSEISDLKSQVEALTEQLAKHTDTTDLQALADDMQTVVDAPEPVKADPAAEAPVAPAPFQVVSTPTGEVAVNQTDKVSTHVADQDGTKTYVDHSTGEVQAFSSDGAQVTPSPAVVAELVAASSSVGVTLPETVVVSPVQ